MNRRSRDLARARDLARDLARDRDRALGWGLFPASNLFSVLERALGCAHELERILQAGTTQEGATSSRVPERVSRGLVALAVRVLPMRDQLRYSEEFRVELVDLPRSERWGYALRILVRAWALRQALAETTGTSDAVPVRSADW